MWGEGSVNNRRKISRRRAEKITATRFYVFEGTIARSFLRYGLRAVPPHMFVGGPRRVFKKVRPARVFKTTVKQRSRRRGTRHGRQKKSVIRLFRARFDLQITFRPSGTKTKYDFPTAFGRAMNFRERVRPSSSRTRPAVSWTCSPNGTDTVRRTYLEAFPKCRRCRGIPFDPLRLRRTVIANNVRGLRYRTIRTPFTLHPECRAVIYDCDYVEQCRVTVTPNAPIPNTRSSDTNDRDWYIF